MSKSSVKVLFEKQGKFVMKAIEKPFTQKDISKEVEVSDRQTQKYFGVYKKLCIKKVEPVIQKSFESLKKDKRKKHEEKPKAYFYEFDKEKAVEKMFRMFENFDKLPPQEFKIFLNKLDFLAKHKNKHKKEFNEFANKIQESQEKFGKVTKLPKLNRKTQQRFLLFKKHINPFLKS